ncbi:hypothetical protein C8R46DRAFT_1328207 [Mycena filopes]|nr:hypothetical protein C8R46DRAFT_1328207 [Mycena filopes]
MPVICDKVAVHLRSDLLYCARRPPPPIPMPATNYTVDDVSPMIQYAPPDGWAVRNVTDDDSGDKGSSATLVFSGTQVWVTGAKRSNHDGSTTQYDGFSKDDDFSGLFDSGPLAAGRHTLIITNQQNDSDKSFLELDSITWSTDSATADTQVDDTTSQFSYQPSDSWSTSLPNDIHMPGFQNGSGQCACFQNFPLHKLILVHHTSFTWDTDASAILSFSGDTVALVGAVGPDLGPFSIKIDNMTIGTFNASKQNYVAQTELFRANDLGAGNHTLEVVNQGSTENQGLAIDFAQVVGLPSASASISASATPSASASVSASAVPKPHPNMVMSGVFIGAAVGIVALTATLGGLVYRQKNRRKMQREAMRGSTDVSAFVSPKGAVSLQPVDSNVESETTHLLDPRSTAA